MNRTRITTFVAVSATSILLAACGGNGGGGGGGGGGAEAPIVVGAVYSVTGSQASIDEPGLNGFQLAADQINADGGVLGRQIEVAHVDAQSDQTTLTNVVSELIDNDGAVALGGINDSTFALAAGPIAQTSQVPFVVSGATLPTLPEQVGDYFFMVPFGDDSQAYAIADYATNELGGKTAWALVDQAYDFTTALNGFFRSGGRRTAARSSSRTPTSPATRTSPPRSPGSRRCRSSRTCCSSPPSRTRRASSPSRSAPPG